MVSKVSSCWLFRAKGIVQQGLNHSNPSLPTSWSFSNTGTAEYSVQDVKDTCVSFSTLSPCSPPLWYLSLTTSSCSSSQIILAYPAQRAHRAQLGFCSCSGLAMCLQTQSQAPVRFPSSVSFLPAFRLKQCLFHICPVFQLFTVRKQICYHCGINWKSHIRF